MFVYMTVIALFCSGSFAKLLWIFAGVPFRRGNFLLRTLRGCKFCCVDIAGLVLQTLQGALNFAVIVF